MILGGVNFGTTFLGLYVVEHFGRRKSLVFGAAWMFVCFMVFASVGHFSLDRDVPQNTPHSGKAMIVFACLFILGFATTWGPIVWTICAERMCHFYYLNSWYILGSHEPNSNIYQSTHPATDPRLWQCPRPQTGFGIFSWLSLPLSLLAISTFGTATSSLDVFSSQQQSCISSSSRDRAAHSKKSIPCIFCMLTQ